MKKILKKTVGFYTKLWKVISAMIERAMLYIKLVLFGKTETRLRKIPEAEVPKDIIEQELKNSIDSMLDRMGITN